MKTFNRHSANRSRLASFTLFAFVLTFFFQPPVVLPQVVVTTIGTGYTQNFDTLPASGSATWTNNSTIPGWFHARTGTGATIVANDGSSNAGNLYSYGTGTATDRALGSLGSGNAAVGNLFWGVRLQNNTGATINALNVSYVGEQWRNSAAAAQTVSFSYLVGSPTVTGSLAEFQSAGVAVPQLDFTSPITGGTAGALNGNLAANRVSITHTITGLNIPNGTEIMLRWSDPDHTGADHGLAIDDLSVTPQGGGPVFPNLSVNNVTQAEGDAGTTNFTFTVSLSAPAGAGGVTFDIATADGTAQDDNPSTEDNDYVANSLTGQTIPAGSSTYSFNVSVNGDTTVEPNETFFVNVTNVTGANVIDGQGQGTINNDDVSLTPIHDIQGPGASSPIVGAFVTTRGIVTGVKNNGFFIQEPDATVDADPATSEGIFVFTNSAPPVAAAVGNLVQVTGTVTEFVPSSDPLQPPLTELTGPTVSLMSTGNPLPTAIPLTPTFPDPAGPFDQLERVEGMRVGASSLTVAAPTQGNVNEPNATATSTGVFFGTVTGVPRPFREPGIQAPDPAPSGGGSIPPIPRWDSNPELLRVDSDGLVGAAALEVSTGAVVTGLAGPLDYGFRRYTILPQTTPTVSGGATATAAAPPEATDITVASYNLERFYDDVNDPSIGEPVLTAAAYDRRLSKASQGIRNYLHAPDILGVVEVENLSTLQDLADRINADAVADSQPNPQYAAYLVEGNDVGGIDVGFLVKTSVVSGGLPRVEVVEVQQELDGTLFVNPDSSTETLNDRPPLRLKALVRPAAGGAAFPLTVIVNHLRSLNDVDSSNPGGSGWPTVGARVRAKRQKQAEDLANLVQARQIADPTERIMLIGDFNAFEFNDGYVDSLGVIEGAPAPDNETAVPGDGVDLVNPDLDNLFDTVPPSERYSFVFQGNAQSLDHIIVNQALVSAAASVRLDHARINADFPQTARNTTGVERLADHDPLIAFITPVITPPSAADDSFATNEDAALNVAAPGVLDNDSANGNGSLVATLITGPTNAAAFNLNANGSFTYTPAANFNGTDSFTYKASAGGLESNTATVTINVAAVNDAPSFTKGADQNVLEDAGAQSVSGWATNISPGPANESGQTVNFVVSNNNNALFSVQPTVAPNGTLSFTPAPNAFGAATVTVQIADNGGTANGGVDTSAPQTFTINVAPVNDRPTFTSGGNVSSPEDVVYNQAWATNISPGPANESSQTVSFIVTNNTNPALFAAGPAIASNGALSFTPALNAFGSAQITVVLKDNGGTANGGQDTSAPPVTFTITVTPVNDAPTVTVIPGAGCSVEPSGVLKLQLADVDSPMSSLTLTGTSSNTAAVPNPQILFGTDRQYPVVVVSAQARATVQTAVVTLTVSDGQAGGASSITVRVIVGTNAGQTLNGTNGVDMIFGLGGNDTINAYGGIDLVCGGAGDDTINGGAGDDTLDGEAGNDTLRGEAGNDLLIGGDGNDILQGGADNDTMTGGAGADWFIGGAGIDTPTDFNYGEGDIGDPSVGRLFDGGDAFIRPFELWSVKKLTAEL